MWLYALSQAKNSSMKKMWISSDKKWNLEACSPLNDREIALSNQISSGLPYPMEDKGMCKPIWKLENNKAFFTASVKKTIQISPLNGNNGVDTYNFQSSLKITIPKKCKFFLWSILHEGINTYYGGSSKKTAKNMFKSKLVCYVPLSLRNKWSFTC